jgi:hypothetical protein
MDDKRLRGLIIQLLKLLVEIDQARLGAAGAPAMVER